jgi:hypothetical protein
VNASGKAGIQGLVYAHAGYNATRDEVIGALEQFVSKEAREYEKEFSGCLYEGRHRLYEI